MNRRNVATLVALGAAAAWCAPAPAPIVRPLAELFRIPRTLNSDGGIALTFDDGPHPQGTPAVLDILRDADATATFFLVGEQVERWPRIAADIAAAGHEIALHGYRHRNLLRRTPRGIAADLDRAMAVIAAATDREPGCYRPPYGVFSPAGLAAAQHRGLAPLLWSRWGCDWRACATPQSVARRATRELTPGDVILLHDADHYSCDGSWRTTVAALPLVLAAIAATAEPFVGVSHAM